MTASAGAVLDRPRVLGWLALALIVLAAWIAILALHGRAGAEADWLAALGMAAPGHTGFATLAAMWVLMGAAMMLPTAAPAIDIYVRLSRRIEARRAAHVSALASGYLAAWTGFSVVAAGGQVALAAAIGTGAPDLPRGALAGGLLLLAGLYQLTPLKQACLTKCRNPLAFFVSHWRDGVAGAARMGLHHGAICVGCCWALMGLMFLFGAANLAWMAVLGLVMLLEKTAPGAGRAGRLTGLAMALAGAVLIVTDII